MTIILHIVGARPQFIKLAPVTRAFDALSLPYKVLHTGQHYDYTMSALHFTALGMKEPDFNLEIGSDTHARQTSRMLTGIEDIMNAEKPAMVLVYGDTNSTLAAALCAAKLGIPTGHVEAGVRSYDRRMPEEINRVVADHLSTWHFCPTRNAVSILQSEGIKGILTGDVMYDVLLQVQQLKLTNPYQKPYILATVHRAENTDSTKRFKAIWEGMKLMARDVPVIFPAHVRTWNRYQELLSNKRTPDIRVIEPVSYLEMIAMTRDAQCILTDSGGLQKEAFLLGTPCVTVRDVTEWPETVESGANRLVEADENSIYNAVKSMLHCVVPMDENPFGDGKASEKIARHINEHGL
jgi:UDP-N-acetylglucosamine 2-epimerase